MNTEFFEALALLEKEKGIPADYLLEKIKAAIAIAVKRDYGGSENGQVEIDPEKGKFQRAMRACSDSRQTAAADMKAAATFKNEMSNS